MSKQTSIEWFAKMLAEQGLLVTRDYENLITYRESKQMHKEEIVNAVDGFPLDKRHLDGEDYYQETYGGNHIVDTNEMIDHIGDANKMVEISDDEIDKAADSLYYGTNFKLVFTVGAQWYRKQLKK
jgi:hypothetical protein